MKIKGNCRSMTVDCPFFCKREKIAPGLPRGSYRPNRCLRLNLSLRDIVACKFSGDYPAQSTAFSSWIAKQDWS